MAEYTVRRVHEQFNGNGSIKYNNVLDYVVQNTGSDTVHIGRSKLPLAPGRTVSLGNSKSTQNVNDAFEFQSQTNPEIQVMLLLRIDPAPAPTTLPNGFEGEEPANPSGGNQVSDFDQQYLQALQAYGFKICNSKNE